MSKTDSIVPIWEKLTLSVEEASEYSGIGIHKIRELMNESDSDFTIRIGTKKRLIKRKEFEKYILARHAI